MTIPEIIKAEIRFDLSMYKGYRAKSFAPSDEWDKTYYRDAANRSWYRIEAKVDLAMALGYTVLFDDEDVETMDVVAVYPTELDE